MHTAHPKPLLAHTSITPQTPSYIRRTHTHRSHRSYSHITPRHPSHAHISHRHAHTAYTAHTHRRRHTRLAVPVELSGRYPGHVVVVHALGWVGAGVAGGEWY